MGIFGQLESFKVEVKPDEPEEAPLQRGEKVMLASGGPWMLVESTDETGANCLWMTTTGEKRREWFPAEFLIRWQPGFG